MSDNKPVTMPPIPYGMKRKEILAALECRAKHPETWAAQWPDDSELLTARDRFSRILLHDCGHWPNVFFIPDDDIYTIVATDSFFKSFFLGFDAIELIMLVEEAFDIRIDDETARKMPFSETGRKKATYEMFLQAILNIVSLKKMSPR